MERLEKKKLINRYFSGILYEEDENYKDYMERIIKNFYEVTWITHDRDLKEEVENGEEVYKKKHTHILFKVGENARHRHAIAKIIGIGENYIERL